MRDDSRSSSMPPLHEQQHSQEWKKPFWHPNVQMQRLWLLSCAGQQATRKNSWPWTGDALVSRAAKSSWHGAIAESFASDGAKLVKKKAQQLPDFKSTIEKGRADDQLEVDEMFTYVSMKINQVRVWIAQNYRNRQIVSFFIGDGSMESCKRLWRKLPYEYLKCTSFSDFWKAYHCLPEETHFMVGKETGLTNHVERLNNTLRQRISRFVRKTLSFSKKEYMLNLHFKLFAYHFNINAIS